MSEKQLLLDQDSETFHNSTIIDNIHQSIIELELNPPKENVERLLKEAISYSNNDLNETTMNELTSLIYSCLSHLPDQKDKFCNDIFQNALQNSNKLIIFVSLLSYFPNSSAIDNFQSFISDISKQILKHIKNPTEKFVIFGLEIDKIYEANFISDIILKIKLTEKVISVFYPYIFSLKNLSQMKIKKLIEKVHKMNLIEFLPNEILSNTIIFDSIDQETMSFLIPKMNEQIFTQMFNKIENKILNEKKLNKTLVTSILDKFVEFNIDINSFRIKNQIFDCFDESMMKMNYWDYFATHEITLSDQVSSKIKEFPIKQSVLKVINNICYVPLNVIVQGFYESDNLELLDRYQKAGLNEIEIENNLCKTKDFWIHTFSVVSNVEEKSFSPRFFASIFQKNVDCEKVFDFLEAMIFHKFPTTHNGNLFLTNLLNEFSQEYKNNFIKNLNLLLDKVIDSKALPLTSFWLLFDFEFINNLFENGNKNPLILFAYQFSNCCSKRKEITKLTIPSNFNDKNKDLIINFIKSHDFNILVNLDDDLMSFFISAAIFANQGNEIFIEEIAAEIILPFFAVSLIYMKKFGGKIFLKSPGLKGLFISAFRLYSKSDDLLIIESINLIVNLCNYIFDSSSFSTEIAFKIFNTLLIQLINDTYKPDKANLIRNFFALNNKYSTNSNVKCLYDKNGINLFNYIIRNISKITNFDKLGNSLVNLKHFNKEKITFLLNEKIKKSLIYEDIINTIYFLEKYCIEIPKLSLNNYKNLQSVVNKALAKNDWSKFMHLNNFIVKNNFDTFKQLSFRNYNITEKNIENLIDYSMNIQQIEKDEIISNIYFNILMNNMSIAVNYVTALFENITENNVVIPYDIFENYYDKYKKYPDVFRKAIQHSFKLCTSPRKVFIRIKNWILNEEPFLVTILLQKMNQKQEDYELYFILKNIASSFPFLFDKNPTQIFRDLLPALDSFSLIFTNQNDIQSIKIALAAQSFLISILHSVKVLESFIQWILNIIDSLSPSQVLSFTFILESLINTKKVKDVLMILMIKNSFPFRVVKLFKIEVQDQIRQIYKEKIFNLLFLFFTELNKLNNTHKVILYDEIINYQNDNKPAERMFSPNITILPSQIKPLNLLSYIKNDEIIEFINDINRPRSFWLGNKNNFNVSNDEINTFLNNFLAFPKLDEVVFQIGRNLVFIRILAEYPNWVYQYAVEDKKFPLVFDSQMILRNALSSMNDMFNYYCFHRYYNTEIDYTFRDVFSDNNIYNLFLNEIELYDDNDILIKIMEIILTNETAIDSFQNTMKSFISKNIKLNKIDKIHKIINAINEIEIKFNEKFNICEDHDLIDYALLPENRQNNSFISSLFKFISLTENVPIKATHLIGLYLIIDDQKDFPRIYKICKKIGENNLCNIKKIIKNISEILLKNKETSYELIISIFEAFPSFINSHTDLVPLLIDKLFMKFKEGDKSSIDSITFLFNSISPEPNNDLNEIDISIDELSNESSRPNSARSFAKSNPEFWGIYNKYRDHINKIVGQNIDNHKKFKIFEYYPELINFDLRLSFLRENLKKKLSSNETELTIRRSNVLVDSFNQLNDKQYSEWMNKFKISFEDEKGYDEGGLTKEWFTLIIEDLFNPNYALFVQSNNKGYQPNPYSSINNEHIKYFNFAGKLIARAIIQGQCVSAHFTRSFRRQILRTQVKLKDYEDIDKEIYNSMRMILENDADSLGLNFTIDDDVFGNIKTIPLKENGEEIEVTNENKFEYVKLYINYRLKKSIVNQVEAFCQGFNWLIPHDDIKMFSQNELDLIICGIPNIDVEDLRANTVYEKPYNKKHPVIRMFFKVISKWNSDNLAKFLLFLTGSSQVPVNGFKDYKERDKPIKIAPGGDKNRLCVAHTCFNTLDLPAYENEKDLERKLLLAIHECREFALA